MWLFFGLQCPSFFCGVLDLRRQFLVTRKIGTQNVQRVRDALFVRAAVQDMVAENQQVFSYRFQCAGNSDNGILYGGYQLFDLRFERPQEEIVGFNDGQVI